jgi:hypothetical protein
MRNRIETKYKALFQESRIKKLELDWGTENHEIAHKSFPLPDHVSRYCADLLIDGERPGFGA